MQGNALISGCPNAVMINTLISKPTLLLWPENITSSLAMFAAKIAPKQCCLQKIFFKAPILISFSIDDMLAQIVIFRLAVNNQS